MVAAATPRSIAVVTVDGAGSTEHGLAYTISVGGQSAPFVQPGPSPCTANDNCAGGGWCGPDSVCEPKPCDPASALNGCGNCSFSGVRTQLCPLGALPVRALGIIFFPLPYRYAPPPPPPPSSLASTPLPPLPLPPSRVA